MSGAAWTSVRVTGAAEPDRGRVVATLIGAGASGVHEEGDALLTFVPADADLTALRTAVCGVCDSAAVSCVPAPDVSAATRWTGDVGVQRVGALVVAPPWLVDDMGAGARTVVIDPGMAFGTGEHPTTRGVLRLMQRVIRAGDLVADLGAGSAVLAIAAVKLGAARAAAIELDADALGNARENVARNGVADRVAVLEGDAAVLLPLLAPVRVILANIISGTVLELLRPMRAALSPDGRAIVSGMLQEERAHMRAELAGQGWMVKDEDSEDGWWSSVIAKR